VFKGKKVIVVMPAYNAASTILKTYNEILEQEVVDLIIVVDDGSRDATTEIAGGLRRARLFTHPKNQGYGSNQKTCYRLALEEGGDIIIMVHPDYQYTPKLIPAMAALIGNGLYECALGSRILGGGALKGGMPRWRYVANRLLTFVENLLTGGKLSEYHTGYRAFSRRILEQIPFNNNSDDFLFDNQILIQILWLGHTIAEISCPTRYSTESSSINFQRSVVYGFGCLYTAILFRLCKLGIIQSKAFPKNGEHFS
jgi:glycosyltransferase involved in cell wall biosynthesis